MLTVTKLAFIDFDGVIADSRARFAIAEQHREFYRDHLKSALDDALTIPVNHDSVQKSFEGLLESLYWQSAFNPDLVRLDRLIADAPEHIETLKEQWYEVILLTSRPESMRAATIQWCVEHAIDVPYFYLVMKSSASQYVKTTAWKASTVQTLARLFAAKELLFIDDEEANRKEVQAYCGTAVRCFASLAEAVRGPIEAKEVQPPQE